jgi:hypothetical protein
MCDQGDRTPRGRSDLRRAVAMLALGALSVTASCAGEADRADEAKVEGAAVPEVESAVSRAVLHITAPADGSVVDGPDVTVILEVEGLTIVPAGVEQASSGHHHLIVDSPLPDLASPIPADAGRYIHLGQGQTEYLLEGLRPGEHQVIALVGDHLHFPLNPPVADTVRFTVR